MNGFSVASTEFCMTQEQRWILNKLEQQGGDGFSVQRFQPSNRLFLKREKIVSEQDLFNVFLSF